MAFPFLVEEGFEAGTLGAFDAESDSANRLSFPHYSTLARFPGLSAPYRGAFCMMVELAPSATDAYVQETGGYDTSAAGTIWVRFQLYVSANLTMATTDELAIFQLWSGTNTVEGGVYINFTTASGVRLGVGESTASQFLSLSLGQWHTVELQAVIDSGGPNDGTLTLYLDGAAATQVTGLDQAAITSAVYGVIGQDAGTTAGYVLFDDCMADDLQLYNRTIRFPQVVLLTASGHVFMGQGGIEDLTVIDGGSGNSTADLYDTDMGNTTDLQRLVASAATTSNSARDNAANMPVQVRRGCYVLLGGTNPRALVKIGQSQAYWSDAAIRNHGLKRIAAPGDV